MARISSIDGARVDARAARNAGIFLLIGAFLVILGTFLPWTVLQGPLLSSTRTAYELGSHGKVTADPFLILATAALMALVGLDLLGVLRLWSWLKRHPIVPTALAAAAVLQSWLASWPNLGAEVTVQRGIGGWVSLIGVACGGVAAIIVHQGRTDLTPYGAPRRPAILDRPPKVEEEGDSEEELGFVCPRCGSQWVASYEGKFCADCGGPLSRVLPGP